MEETPPLDVMGAHEIRMRLGGLSKQRVHYITNRRDFPKPAAVLRQGSIWYTADVERWIMENRPWLNESDVEADGEA